MTRRSFFSMLAAVAALPFAAKSKSRIKIWLPKPELVKLTGKPYELDYLGCSASTATN